MRKVWKILFNTFCAALILGNCGGLMAQKPASHEAEYLQELNNMSFVQMLNSVELNDKKAADLIVRFQEKEGRSKLHNGVFNSDNGCSVETFRNKEVLLITIPASKLFGPNETELKESVAKFLNPIKRYLKIPDMYRVLIVMHTDNTGSEQYRENLTEARSDAVYDWFDESGVNTDYLFSYAFADDQPLVQNNSIDNREKNRRLEIYLVPGKRMFDEAKKGRIAY